MEVLLTDEKFENFEELVMYGKIENSEEFLMAGKIDNLEEIAIDEQNWAKHYMVKNTQSCARDATEIDDLVEWTNVPTKGPNLGWRHRHWQYQQGQQNQEHVATTKHNFEVTSTLERSHDESD